MSYKYDFTDEEKLALELWYDITELARQIEWILHLSDEEKQIGRKAVNILLCETDNFNEAFLKNGYDSETYLIQVYRGVLKAKEILTDPKDEISRLYRNIENMEQKISKVVDINRTY